jgi:hypothetical protein
VSELEDRISGALRADAATVRPESILGVPPRPPRPGSRRTAKPWSRRRRVLIPLAAAAAVAATVASVSVAVPLLGPGRQGPGSATPEPVLGPTATRGVPASAPAPGVPPFYVTVNDTSNPNKIIYALFVRSTATGANLVAMGAPPGFAQFDAIAATAGDRTFVVAARPDGATSCSEHLYQFQLADGVPGPLVPLHITVPGTFSEKGDLAITPDGRRLAYASYLCGKGDGEIGVIDLATRHVSVWATPAAGSSPSGLSLSDDGRWLAYDTMPGVRLLNTSAPDGPVLAHSKVVSKTADWAALAGDGRSLYGCTVSPRGVPGHSAGGVAYYVQTLATGRQHAIASWANLPSPECWATSDPSGHYLLVQFPAHALASGSDFLRPAVLNIRTGQLTIVAEASAYRGPLDMAW